MPVWSNTPHTWAVGEKLTALLLNAEVRDPLAALGGQWNAYTPQIDQGVTDIGKTVNAARYLQFGKLVFFNLAIIINAAGTSGQIVTATLPVPARGAGAGLGTGTVYTTGPAVWPSEVTAYSVTKMAWGRLDVQRTSYWGADPAAALVSGATLAATGFYEAA